MSPRDIARTARAIFDIAQARQEGPKAAASLEAFGALMTEHDEMRQALTSPFVPASARQGVIDAIAPHLDMPDTVRRSLHIVAEQGALADVPALGEAVRVLVHRAAGIVDATVTTAVPLSPGQMDLLQERLSAATGKQVAVSSRVDPKVIGGVVARVGGVVFDGTLARQLERLHEQLVQRG